MLNNCIQLEEIGNNFDTKYLRLFLHELDSPEPVQLFGHFHTISLQL